MNWRFGTQRSTAAGYVAAIGAVAVALVAAKSFPLLRHIPDPALVFLMAVFASATLGGFGPSMLAVVASVLVYDYFFVDPLYTLHVNNARDVVSLVVFLIVATVTSRIMARLREQAEKAREREARTAALYAFSREAAASSGLSDLITIIARHVGQVFGVEVVVCLPDEGRMIQRAAFPAEIRLPDAQRALAEEAWATGGVASLAHAAPGSWHHVSLGTARGETGVLSLHFPAERPMLSPGEQELLASLTQQAAVAIERGRIDRVLAEKTKTEEVMEASDDGIIVLDSDGRVVHVNGIACAILDMDRDRLLQANFAALDTAHPHALKLRHAVRTFFADPMHEPARAELTVFLRGRDHHYVLRLKRYRTPGAPAPGLIIVLQDVTYVREDEARRENLVATLSHELRTPLTSLRMAVELLRQRAGNVGEDVRQCIDTAFEDVVRLQDVAQQFLDLARAGAMAIGVERRPVNVRDLVARVGRMFTMQAKERGVILDLDDVAAFSLMGDEVKLSWALSNLVGNAIRYTPPGGHVHVAAQSADHALLLSVSDEGPGIPADQRERVFDRFVQGTTAGEMGAAGLGLSIVRDIVQAHRGRVHLDSIMGRGTCFTLELPLD